VAVVDVSHSLLRATHLSREGPYTERVDRRITDLCWTTSNEEVTTTYVNESDTAQEPLYATYRLMSGRWARLSVPDERGAVPDGIVLRVYETSIGLQCSPHIMMEVLLLSFWDPNPQLARLNLSEASRYQWQDESGTKWAGIFVPPATYEPGVSLSISNSDPRSRGKEVFCRRRVYDRERRSGARSKGDCGPSNG